MRIRIVEDRAQNDSLVGCVVFLKNDMPYKNEIVKWIVDGKHRFLVIAETPTTMFVVLTTSQTQRELKSPEDYVRVAGKEKDFLVELNSWGILDKHYVHHVAETISGDDYAKVAERFYNAGKKRDLKIEGLARLRKK